MLRGQTDNPEAPAGFELNNPWRVCALKYHLSLKLMLIMSRSSRSASCRNELRLHPSTVHKSCIEIAVVNISKRTDIRMYLKCDHLPSLI